MGNKGRRVFGMVRGSCFGRKGMVVVGGRKLNYFGGSHSNSFLWIFQRN